ncbi:MAG: nucleotidyl transferase AbiEii/AbiGii toxin family protein [Gammaproteobacteria bacterium]|nr:nucleotidyl transferase AbiEii/AbiGii toxin family protein [Gammaproteobacteria bacterium]
MTYESVAAFRQALEQRLLNQARDTDTDLNRLRRRVVFERILYRLTTSQPGMWVVKGGMAVELRIGDSARMTRDLDLNLRTDSEGATEAHQRLSAAVSTDPTGDGFLFEVSEPNPLQPDQAGRPGWRFSISADLAGRNFATVRIDVVARTDELTSTEMLPLTSLLSFAGFEGFEVEAADVAQQFAEKIHAMTRPWDDRDNTRVKDLADMVVFINSELDPARAMTATRHVFAVRDTHPLPDELPDPPLFWNEDYPAFADELGLAEASIDQAMLTLREFWANARNTEK